MITGLPLIMLLRHHIYQNLQFWLHPLLVTGLLLVSTALPFAASQCELMVIFFSTRGGWPGVGLSALAVFRFSRDRRGRDGGSLLWHPSVNLFFGVK